MSERSKIDEIEYQYKHACEQRDRLVNELNDVFETLNYFRDEYKKLTGKDLNTCGKD